jgi:hypothetical protein
MGLRETLAKESQRAEHSIETPASVSWQRRLVSAIGLPPHGLARASVSATRGWPPSCRYGSMFWFSRKKFVGSYARFSSTKRSYCRSP